MPLMIASAVHMYSVLYDVVYLCRDAVKHEASKAWMYQQISIAVIEKSNLIYKVQKMFALLSAPCIE